MKRSLRSLVRRGSRGTKIRGEAIVFAIRSSRQSVYLPRTRFLRRCFRQPLRHRPGQFERGFLQAETRLRCGQSGWQLLIGSLLHPFACRRCLPLDHGRRQRESLDGGLIGLRIRARQQQLRGLPNHELTARGCENRYEANI